MSDARRMDMARRAVFALVMALLVVLPGVSVAGLGDPRGLRSNGTWDFPAPKAGSSDVEVPDTQAGPAAEGPGATATSSVPKLFWLDCGYFNDCARASLYYVDPAAAVPSKRLLIRNVAMDPQEGLVETGTLDPVTHQMTGLGIGTALYARGGNLWRVDTTTLAVRQVSSETGFTPNLVCMGSVLNDWTGGGGTTVMYVLAGPDGQCWTGDERVRAVTEGMGPADPPIDLGSRILGALLFDGTYLTFNFQPSPHRIEICPPTFSLAGCTAIGTFEYFPDDIDHDANRVLIQVDGKMLVYNIATHALTTVYSPVAGVDLGEADLDRDGYVYFVTTDTTAPQASRIRKVPVGGGAATTLATFTTGGDPPSFELAAGYVVYRFLNPTKTGMMVFSVAKGGAPPVLLANAQVKGGAVGDHLLSESSLGKVSRIRLSDGVVLVTRPNVQLSGATAGGAFDWHYGPNPATMRFFLSTIGNQVYSYSLTENFASAAAGVKVGVVPVNLSNFRAFSMSDDLLGLATKRQDEETSFGQDVLFFKAGSMASLRRITNANGEKLVKD